jgi:hypothetical protein
VLLRQMLPASLTIHQRRWQEADLLLRMGVALGHLPLPALARPAQALVPQVLQEERRGSGGFLVMSSPQGRPLESLLQEQIALGEIESLSLVYQWLAVLTVLHTKLNRAMLHPSTRNLYWERAQQALTVIDFSGLSAEQPDDEESILYLRDRRWGADLLARLLLGEAASTPAQMTALPGWQRISPLSQHLLRAILAPDSPILASTPTFLEAIGQALQRFRQDGDTLLLQAAGLFEKLPTTSDAEDGPEVVRLRQEATDLLNLAESKGISRRMTPIAQELREKLEVDQTSAFYLDRGLTFFQAGDHKISLEYFENAVCKATLPHEQVTAWRWWQVTQTLPAPAKMEALFPRLRAALSDADGDEQTRQQLSKLSWPGLDPVVQEMESLTLLHEMMHLEVKTITAEAQVKAWEMRCQQALETLQKRQDKKYQLGNRVYGDALWQFLAQRSGLADAAQAQQKVNQQRTLIQQRSREISNLVRLFKQPLTLVKASDMLASKVKSVDADDPLAHRHILARVPDWLNGAAQDHSAHDQPLADLLTALETQGCTGEALAQIESYRHHLGLLQSVEWQIAGARLAGLDEAGNRAAIGQILDALIVLLEEIDGEIKGAQERRAALVKRFVDACLAHLYTSPLIEAWLEAHYPDMWKKLVDGLDYEREMAAKRQALVSLAEKIHRSSAVSEQIRADLEKELAQQRQKHEADLEMTRAERERAIAELKTNFEELQTKFNKLDEDYKQETARRESAINRQLADKQQALDGLAAEHARQKQALDSSLQSLQDTLRQKREERTELEKLVNDLRDQKAQLESDLSQRQNQQQGLVRTLSIYQQEVQKIEQKLQKAHTDTRNMDATMERMANEIKQLEQQRDTLQQQVGQARRVAPPNSGRTSSETILRGGDADSAQPLPLQHIFQPQRQPQQPDRFTVENINALLTAVVNIQNEPSSMSLPERLSNALWRQAANLQPRFNEVLNRPSTAQDILEQLGHIYLLIDDLNKMNPGSAVIHENRQQVRQIRDQARLAFRKRWVKE